MNIYSFLIKTIFIDYLEEDNMNTLGVVWDWESYISALDGDTDWLTSLVEAITWVLWVVLILVAAVGAIYAVWLGIQMAKAESEQDREEAKKKIIYTIIAIAVTVALIIFFNVLLPAILSSFTNTNAPVNKS